MTDLDWHLVQDAEQLREKLWWNGGCCRPMSQGAGQLGAALPWGSPSL